MNGTGSGPVLPQAAACVNPQSSDAPTTISTDTQRSNHAVEAALRVGAVVEDDAMLTSAGAGARRAARSGGRDLISIAPMMEVTDRYYRTFMRHLTKHTKLYTEMVVDDTILHQRHNLERFLGYDEVQHPVAIQLGGDSAEKLSECSDICRQWGYDEINLNCGCPSKRVVSKCFGAKLMLDPEKVREITASMRRRALDCPVTVKCRLGADERDSYSDLCEFVATASQSGVKHFIVHARKCLLDGLSTKQNRVIPKLKYHWVFKLCRDFPDLEFSLNGHVASIAEARALLQPIPVDIACDEQKLGEYLRKRTHDQENRLGASRRNTVLSIGLRGGSASGIGGGGGGGGAARQDLHNSELLSTSQGRVDMPPLLSSIERVCDDDVSVQGSVRLNSVMVGRAAWHDPWTFADADSHIFGAPAPPHPSRSAAIKAYINEFVEPSLEGLSASKRLHDTVYRRMLVPVVNVFKGTRGGAGFARHLGRLGGGKITKRFSDVVEEALENQAAAERKAVAFEARRRGQASLHAVDAASRELEHSSSQSIST